MIGVIVFFGVACSLLMAGAHAAGARRRRT